MAQNGESPDRIPMGPPAPCPKCGTEVIPANVVVGWSEGSTFERPLGPTVWITCRKCVQHLKFVDPPYAPRDMDDALGILEEGQ